LWAPSGARALRNSEMHSQSGRPKEEEEHTAVEKVGEKYRCNVCGNEVTVIKVGGDTLVCCGQEMEKVGWTCQTRRQYRRFSWCHSDIIAASLL